MRLRPALVPRLSAVALAIGSVLVALVATEVLLRALHVYPALQSEWILTSPYVAPSDDVIMIPRRLLAPSLYETHGEAPLILTIGDSFTQSYPVEEANTYPAVLERLLARRGRPARVVNAGMGDSGPDQQLRLLETHLLPRLHPTAVVWSLYANDLWDNVLKAVYVIQDGRLVPIPGSANWMARRQRLFEWAPLPDWVTRRSYAFRLLLKATELGDWASVPRTDTGDPTVWGLRKLGLEIEALDRLARADGFAAYLVVIAPQALYLARRDPAWEGRWSASDYRRIAALVHGRADVIDAWFGATRTLDIFADQGRDVSELGDRHFNEAGYALLAVTVAKRLLHDGALSPARDRRRARSGPVPSPRAAGSGTASDP